MSPSLGKMGLRAQTSSDLQYLSLTSHTESGLFSASIKNRSKVGRLKRFSINSVPSRWLWREWWAPKFLLVCLPLSCKVTRLRMFLAWTPDYLASIYSRPFKDPSLHRPPPPSTSPQYVMKDTGESCMAMPSVCVLSPFLPPTSVRRRLGLHVSWICAFWVALCPNEKTRW